MDRKAYLKNYQRKWMAKRRSDFFGNKSCVICGSQERLELDHINPEEKITHKIWSWAKEKFELEAKKCQVLCNKCHKEKTKKWREEHRHHGLTLYKYGCRCIICYTSQQKHNARRNKKPLL